MWPVSINVHNKFGVNERGDNDDIKNDFFFLIFNFLIFWLRWITLGYIKLT